MHASIFYLDINLFEIRNVFRLEVFDIKDSNMQCVHELLVSRYRKILKVLHYFHLQINNCATLTRVKCSGCNCTQKIYEKRIIWAYNSSLEGEIRQDFVLLKSKFLRNQSLSNARWFCAKTRKSLEGKFVFNWKLIEQLGNLLCGR